ncbi:MAG TPA: hypothetical protein VN915_13025 [Elusimicrobiota bacterium]|nr:hypothetical protein [Elusimicrobiota bacterium]
MKTLLLAAAFLTAATAARAACTPTAEDYQSLAESPSHLTQDKWANLSAAQQKSVCDSRAFIKLVDDQGGQIDKIGSYSIKYLSPAENDRIVDATNQYLYRIMASKGIGSATV